jgi:hypothetical protein
LLWIQYDSNQIVAWYCKCKAGARVVGVCAHIPSVLLYLGYARHNSDRRYGVRNWGDFLEDANVVSQPIDESNSEGSVVEE